MQLVVIWHSHRAVKYNLQPIRVLQAVYLRAVFVRALLGDVELDLPSELAVREGDEWFIDVDAFSGFRGFILDHLDLFKGLNCYLGRSSPPFLLSAR